MTNDELKTLEAVIHAIGELRELASLRDRAEEAEEAAALYRRDWYEAKTEYGAAMSKMRQENRELTARAEKAEKESKRLRDMLAIGGAVGCLDRRREECEGCDDYDTCTASSAKWPKTPTQAKDEQ